MHRAYIQSGMSDSASRWRQSARERSCAVALILLISSFFPLINAAAASGGQSVSLSSSSSAVVVPATQTVTLTSTGNAPATLSVQFAPTSADAVTGQLSIISNLWTNGTALTNLSAKANSSFANVSIAMTPGAAIPATFMGLSHEWGSAQAMMGDSTTGVDKIYRQLLKNLTAYGSGPLYLRIGGLSTDRSGEPTSTTTQPFAELANALGVHFSLGVNLASANVNLAVDQARAYVRQMPAGSLDAIEIGNEPDDYADEGLRPAPYTFQKYLAEFNKWKTNIMDLLPSDTKLMGPSWACACHLTNAQPFDSAEAKVLGPFSEHYYLANGSASNADDLLLTPGAATAGANAVATAVATAHQYGIPFRMGEMNSLYNGGKAGISNTFQSALWAIDTMFEYVNAGVDGVNWQGVADNGAHYNPFYIKTGLSAGIRTYTLVTVHPIYVGYVFFQQATGKSAHLLPVTMSTHANLKAWATMDASHTPRLELINKDRSSTGTVDVTLSGYNHAQIYRLTAPSYQSTTRVTFAGQTFDGSKNGVIQGTQTVESVDVSNGVFQIPMPITSAALVVFTK